MGSQKMTRLRWHGQACSALSSWPGRVVRPRRLYHPPPGHVHVSLGVLCRAHVLIVVPGAFNRCLWVCCCTRRQCTPRSKASSSCTAPKPGRAWGARTTPACDFVSDIRRARVHAPRALLYPIHRYCTIFHISWPPENAHTATRRCLFGMPLF